MDIGWFTDAIGLSSSDVTSDLGQGAAQLNRAADASRIGSRASRIVRIIRLIRLIRIVKLYKATQQAQEKKMLKNKQIEEKKRKEKKLKKNLSIQQIPQDLKML